jgi:predicted metal-dependent hydrolase
VTKNFWSNRFDGMLELLAQDGITGWKAKARIFWYMLGNPGPMRRLLKPWAAFFLPGFHPWNHDDRNLIALVDSEYEDARLPEGKVLA